MESIHPFEDGNGRIGRAPEAHHDGRGRSSADTAITPRLIYFAERKSSGARAPLEEAASRRRGRVAAARDHAEQIAEALAPSGAARCDSFAALARRQASAVARRPARPVLAFFAAIVIRAPGLRPRPSDFAKAERWAA